MRREDTNRNFLTTDERRCTQIEAEKENQPRIPTGGEDRNF
jgi:hypothetical protein